MSEKAEVYSAEIVDENDELFDYYDYPELYDQNSTLKRSNVLIKSRYRGTLLESKLLALSMYRIQRARQSNTCSDTPSRQTRQCRFTTSELKALLYLDEGNSYVYSRLKTVASNLIDHKFFIEDVERQRWAYYALLEAAEYENGVMTLTLSESAWKHLTKLQSNWTGMAMPILLGFGVNTEKGKAGRQNFTYRIYEILRTHLFRCTSARETFRIKYYLADLKITLGVISPDDPGVRDAILKNPGDMELALDKYASKKGNSSYSRWSDFERRILRVAQEECKSTDLLFTYQPVRTGRGGRVTEIIFTIMRNPDYKLEKDTNIAPDVTLVEQVSEMLDGRLRTKTVMRLLSVAGNDLEKIRRAIVVAEAQKEPIKNLAGFLIRAIQESWEVEDATSYVPRGHGLMYEMQPARKKKRDAAQKKNPFNNFEQNEYDFEQLELELLSN